MRPGKSFSRSGPPLPDELELMRTSKRYKIFTIGGKSDLELDSTPSLEPTLPVPDFLKTTPPRPSLTMALKNLFRRKR